MAGNVTCEFDGATDGTKWSWAAFSFNGVSPATNGWNFVPDHTCNGEAYGGMLYLNCGNEPNTVIYSREFACLDAKNYTAKCFINNFANVDEPVVVKLRLTDLASGEVVESAEVSRKGDGTDGIEWKEVSVDISLTGNSLKLEIVSVAGGSKVNRDGNDLILDDVQLFAIDDAEVVLPQKLIWQDDFGTFTEKGKYWVWDYSDLSNPKKVQKQTSDGWAYELPDEVAGAKYSAKGDLSEGQYAVAGNVTCEFDGATDGTKWSWDAFSFNGVSPATNGWDFVPDHTYNGEAYGGMLYLNCSNEPNAVIYSREFAGIDATNYTAKCFINNFANADEPVVVKLRLTDLASGEVVESEDVSRKGDGTDGIEWKEVSVDILLTGNSLKLEIISVAGGTANASGNDLILDDVQLWENSTNSIKSVSSALDFEVVNVADGLMIMSTEPNNIAIYSISGNVVWRGIIDGSKSISLAKGIYVVSNGSSSIKSIVK